MREATTSRLTASRRRARPRAQTLSRRACLRLAVKRGTLALPVCAAAPWPGVDETVIEKVAAEAGRPAREPYINTDQGDLLLFLFLVAGAVGGFVAGYTFRGLFPPGASEKEHS